jgi:hypothetical protein
MIYKQGVFCLPSMYRYAVVDSPFQYLSYIPPLHGQRRQEESCTATPFPEIMNRRPHLFRRDQFLDLVDESVKALRIFQADNDEMVQILTWSTVRKRSGCLTTAHQHCRRCRARGVIAWLECTREFDPRDGRRRTTRTARSLVCNCTAVHVLERNLKSIGRNNNW